MNKHFLKTVILFAGMIIAGMIGLYLVNHYGFGFDKIPPDANIAK